MNGPEMFTFMLRPSITMGFVLNFVARPPNCKYSGLGSTPQTVSRSPFLAVPICCKCFRGWI